MRAHKSKTPILVPQIAPQVLPIFDDPPPFNGPAYAQQNAHVIPNDKSIANVVCFGAFADKISGLVYNDLTRNFPFRLIDGNVCFFIMYRYKTNAIMAKPIANLNDKTIFKAYNELFECLEGKWYKQKIIVMDNSNKIYQNIPH